MKQGWTYKKLGEVCEVINGLWKGKKAPFINVGVIRNANFTKDFCLRYDNIEFLDVEERQYSKRKLLKGDLIVEKSGGSEKQPVGRAVLFDKDEGEFSFSNFTSVLRIKKDIDLTSKFLYIYLLYIYKRGDTASMQKATTGIHNIEFEKYLNIDIPYIPLSEQQRIVSRLDSAFAHIDELKANAEKQVNEARALFQKALSKAMEPKEGWEEKTLKDLSSIIGDGIHGTPKYSNDGEYFFINGNNLENGRIVIKENTKRVNHEEYQKYYLDLNDSTVLLSINGTIGKTAFYNGEPLVLGKSACYINVLPSLLKEYLRYYLLSDIFLNYSQKNSRQATIVNLGLKEIRKMPISIPPLSEQQRIVERLDSLSKNVKALEENQRKVMAECEALKQALLRKVFE